jgi:hypothetical protein
MKFVVILLSLVVLALSVSTGYLYTRAAESGKALCSLRDNLEARVVSSQQYLDDVRSGERKPIVGVTEADIQTSIDNQRQTIDALSNLNCKQIGDA